MFLAGLLLPAAQAHPLAPALLELKELDAGRYAVLWRTSVARVQGTDVQPLLPPACRPLTEARWSAEENQSRVARWEADCGPQGITGQTLGVSGLEYSRISVILRIESQSGAVVTQLLDIDRPVFVVPAPTASPPVFHAYLGLGVEHLLFGLDHVLFVIGLVLLVRKLRPLVVTVTAFTLGHSVTLALATLGFVHINSALTELAIAFSIIVLALELVRPRPQSLFRRRPWLMALAFGLLHGLGFAGALAEVGLPAGEIPLALLAFNLGIELGQLALVAGWLALAAVLVRLDWRKRWRKRGRTEVFASKIQSDPFSSFSSFPAEGKGAGIAAAYLIGSLAAYWCIERAVVLFA